MKILLIVDFHNQFNLMPELNKKAAQADIIIDAGDQTIFEHEIHKVLREYNKWGKPVLLIHGNHESEETLKKASKNYKNIQYIHGEIKKIKGITLFGWGGGGFSKHDYELENKIAELKKRIEKELKGPLIIVTHAPPYKTKLDDLGYPVGNKTIKNLIKELKPDIAVSGHIHETAGRQDLIGKTKIINPGPIGMLIEI